MIEEDPDVESYYKLGNASCHIPVRIHACSKDLTLAMVHVK